MIYCVKLFISQLSNLDTKLSRKLLMLYLFSSHLITSSFCPLLLQIILYFKFYHSYTTKCCEEGGVEIENNATYPVDVSY